MEICSVDYRIEMETKSTLGGTNQRPEIFVQFHGKEKSESIRFHVDELSYCIEKLEEALKTRNVTKYQT